MEMCKMHLYAHLQKHFNIKKCYFNSWLKGVDISLVIYPGDHTLKLWDIRSFKAPVAVVTDLENNFAG